MAILCSELCYFRQIGVCFPRSVWGVYLIMFAWLRLSMSKNVLFNYLAVL